MPNQVVFAMAVETAMIIVTLLLLNQPNIFLPFRSPRVQTALRAGGLIMLSLTFCWSVILGCVITLHQMTFRI